MSFAVLTTPETRRERIADYAAMCHGNLRDELLAALMEDPARPVCTPGYRVNGMTPASEVVYDDLADDVLHELLRIVALCASGKADNDLHLRASAWIAARCTDYANFHADDAAAEMED